MHIQLASLQRLDDMQSDVLHDMIINSTHTYKHTDFFFFFCSFGKKEGGGGCVQHEQKNK